MSRRSCSLCATVINLYGCRPAFLHKSPKNASPIFSDTTLALSRNVMCLLNRFLCVAANRIASGGQSGRLSLIRYSSSDKRSCESSHTQICFLRDEQTKKSCQCFASTGFLYPLLKSVLSRRHLSKYGFTRHSREGGNLAGCYLSLANLSAPAKYKSAKGKHKRCRSRWFWNCCVGRSRERIDGNYVRWVCIWAGVVKLD